MALKTNPKRDNKLIIWEGMKTAMVRFFNLVSKVQYIYSTHSTADNIICTYFLKDNCINGKVFEEKLYILEGE
jgi:hypothetical protein